MLRPFLLRCNNLAGALLTWRGGSPKAPLPRRGLPDFEVVSLVQKGRNHMNSNNPGQDNEGTSDARLDSLDLQLKAARKAEAVRAGKDQVPAKGMRQGNRVLT